LKALLARQPFSFANLLKHSQIPKNIGTISKFENNINYGVWGVNQPVVDVTFVFGNSAHFVFICV
jgi:hypothetical protein